MSKVVFVPRLELYERQTAMFRARLAGLEGALLTQATTSSISWAVYDLSSDTPTVAIETASAVVADSILDTPSNLDWPFPDGGHNFVVGIAYGSGAGQIPWKGLHRYRVRFTVQHLLVSGPTGAYPDGPFIWEYEVHPQPGFSV